MTSWPRIATARTLKERVEHHYVPLVSGHQGPEPRLAEHMGGIPAGHAHRILHRYPVGYEIPDPLDHGRAGARDHVVRLPAERAVPKLHLLAVGPEFTRNLLRGAYGVRDQDDAVQGLVPGQEEHEFRVDVAAVRYDLAGNLRMDEHGSHRVGIPVVHLAHPVEEVGRVQYARLHTFHHVLVGGVGMPRRQDDALLGAVEGKLPHPLELGSDGHHEDASPGGCLKFLHEIQVHRTHRLGALDTQAVRGDERTLQVQAQDARPGFRGPGRSRPADTLHQFLPLGGIEGGTEGGYPIAGQRPGHLLDLPRIAFLRTPPRESVDMLVDEAGRDIGALDIQDLHARLEAALGVSTLVEDVGDHTVLEQQVAGLHGREPGEHRAVA